MECDITFHLSGWWKDDNVEQNLDKKINSTKSPPCISEVVNYPMSWCVELLRLAHTYEQAY